MKGIFLMMGAVSALRIRDEAPNNPITRVVDVITIFLKVKIESFDYNPDCCKILFLQMLKNMQAAAEKEKAEDEVVNNKWACTIQR